MFIKLKFIVILSLFLILGCASKVTILLDGTPIPTYAYHMKSPAMEGLEIEVVAAQYIIADEEGEQILWPIHFKVDETYYVDPDNTKYVKIMVKIYNPNKTWYELREHNSSKPLIGRGENNISIDGIYSGRLRFNNFDITHVVLNNTVQMHKVEVRDKQGLSIIRIGSFSYKTIRPDSDQEEGGG